MNITSILSSEDSISRHSVLSTKKWTAPQNNVSERHLCEDQFSVNDGRSPTASFRLSSSDNCREVEEPCTILSSADIPEVELVYCKGNGVPDRIPSPTNHYELDDSCYLISDSNTDTESILKHRVRTTTIFRNNNMAPKAESNIRREPVCHFQRDPIRRTGAFSEDSCVLYEEDMWAQPNDARAEDTAFSPSPSSWCLFLTYP
eukprot:Nitzschia sp. Nitz4//scaffold279_size24496//14863//15471//NITZ4_008382-RA/size24496-processed-gene-0.22-mRNA-1//-1//CDS//3329545397//152//frame0